MKHRLGLVLEIAVPVVLVALWWMTSSKSTSFAFPPLSDIVGQFFELWIFDRVGSDVIPSLLRFAAGFSISCVLGVAGGLILSSNVLLYRLFDPPLQFIRAVPPIVFLPVFLFLLGVGDLMKIVLIIFGAVWPVLLNTVTGVRSLEPVLRDTCYAYRIPRRNRFLHVILPAISPNVMAGMRTALAIAFILMVVSEMVAATNGLGYFVVQSQRSYAIADMWAGILLLGILGFTLNAAFSALERRVLYWHHDFRTMAPRKPLRQPRSPVRR